MSKETSLWDRKGQWYLRLHIPRPLRKFFLTTTGKPKKQIVEPLGDSKSAALRKRDELIVRYRRVFDRLAAGEKLSPEQIKAVVTLDLKAVTERVRTDAYPEPNDVPEQPPELVALHESWEASPEFQAQMPPPSEEDKLDFEVDYVARQEGVQAPARGTPQWKAMADAIQRGKRLAELDMIRRSYPELFTAIAPASIASAPTGETIRQALEAWLAELESDEATQIRRDTIRGHRGRVQAFVDKFTDLPLTSITRETASGFLSGLKCKNQTKNQYAMTLKAIIECARRRGRFPKNEDNPFNGHRRKFERMERDRYTDDEVRTLVNAFGPREIKPKKHSPQTALPWVVAIAAHSGACLEEICQLSVADIQTVGGNGSSVVCFDIHNDDGEHKLKNDETRPRKIPIHSVLVNAGFLDYVKALPQNGLVFPGLIRRASKDNKIGSWVGRLFNKKREALGIKRDDMLLDFHSWRTTAATKMDEAGIPESHMNEVLGHAQKTETTRTYSKGPGIHNLKVAVEAISYEGVE